jgi:hypothetical protein
MSTYPVAPSPGAPLFASQDEAMCVHTSNPVR